MNEKAIDRIREFNRFYMPKLGLLGDHYLDSEFSAAEVRLLFEAYEHDGCNAAYLVQSMNLDKSYVSRMIRAHEKRGYLMRVVSPQDARSFQIHLTQSGRKKTEQFIQKSSQEIGMVLASLTEEDCEKLTQALDTITDILQGCTKKQEE